MPLVTREEWVEPEEAIVYHGVVVHHIYPEEWEDGEAPRPFEYAIYDAKYINSDIGEYDEPIETFDIRELAHLVDMTASIINSDPRGRTTEKAVNHDTILRRLIDWGFVTQEGVKDPAAFPVDTLTLPLPGMADADLDPLNLCGRH